MTLLAQGGLAAAAWIERDLSENRSSLFRIAL
jgi:hypothetical protein